jgi:hypothetical protein
MSELKPEIEARIAQATKALAIAEEQLRSVLATMEVQERAEKRIIGPSLQTAFDGVVTARVALASVLEER